MAEIDFETHAGAPMTVLLTASDGSRYELQVGVVVLNVRETGIKTPDGMPGFQVQAAFAIGTRKVEQ